MHSPVEMVDLGDVEATVALIAAFAESLVEARRPQPLALIDELELFRQAAEVAVAVVGDDDQVLDPDAELARQVDAGLDRHHFAGREHVLGARRDARPLVDLEADAVAEPVAEALAVAGGVDRARGRPRRASSPPTPALTASSAACWASRTIS